MIKTKMDFYREYENMNVNRPMTWIDIREYLKCKNKPKTVTLRSSVKSGKTFYFQTEYDVRKLISKDRNIMSMTVCEDPPNERYIQGEFTRNNGGYYLNYNTLSEPLGRSLKKVARAVTGSSALLLVRRYMDESSLECLFRLTDEYGDRCNVESPVVEFSVHKTSVGCYGWNTIFWEVRNY